MGKTGQNMVNVVTNFDITLLDCAVLVQVLYSIWQPQWISKSAMPSFTKPSFTKPWRSLRKSFRAYIDIKKYAVLLEVRWHVNSSIDWFRRISALIYTQSTVDRFCRRRSRVFAHYSTGFMLCHRKELGGLYHTVYSRFFSIRNLGTGLYES